MIWLESFSLVGKNIDKAYLSREGELLLEVSETQFEYIVLFNIVETSVER